MAIVVEDYRIREDGVKLIKTYSDASMMIEQVGTGYRYEEAIDPEMMHRQYIETDEPIPEHPEPITPDVSVAAAE